MILPMALLFLSAVILVAVAGVRFLRLERRVTRLSEESAAQAAKLGILSRFLRISKTLQPELEAFNKTLQQDRDWQSEGFALEHWRSLRDNDRFDRWRASTDKVSKKETRDDSFTLALDVEREHYVRLNARPFLTVLHHKLPFVVSDEHMAWLEETDSVLGFLGWLIGDIEKNSQGQPPAELESLKSLMLGK
ncbi:MAG: hypothetical protein HY926_00380 [Elusimicrobia bacterium]|nr:hypothetical protein [Elusimicrobiota bacterium]